MTGRGGEDIGTNGTESVTSNTVGAVTCIATATQPDSNSRHCSPRMLHPKASASVLTVFNEVVKVGQMLSARHISGVT